MAGRILIADKVATNRIALKAAAAGRLYDIVCASTPEQVTEALNLPDLSIVILDDDLNTAFSPSLIHRIRSDPRTRTLPVVVLTSRTDTTARLAALAAGADEATSKPVDPELVMARIRSLLRAADTDAALAMREQTVRDIGFAEPAVQFDHPGHVTLVGPNRAAAQTMQSALESHTTLRLTSCGINDVLAAAEEQMAADLYLIRVEQDRAGDAMRLFSELRSRSRTRHSGIIIQMATDAAEPAILALDLGASDVVSRDCGPAEMALRLDTQIRRKRTGDRLRDRVDEGLRLAVVDPLTGLFNRRYAEAHARRIAGDGRYCVIVADIDHFKSVNDRFGHAAGDHVLRQVATRLRDDLRSGDMLARIGGEEFLIVMSGIPPDLAATAAQRLCRTVRAEPIVVPGIDGGLRVTISLGVALAEAGEDLDEAISRADNALYAAKADGRDRFSVAPGAAA